MECTISNQSLVIAAKDQVFCDLAGEVVILNYKDGSYYGLDSIGAYVWNLVQKPKTVTEILDSITNEYAVELENCERDLMLLLHELTSKGLIEVKDEKIT